jgi:hypothetical protein
MRTTIVGTLLVCLFLAHPAAADSGYTFPSKYMVGLDPLGVQINFDDGDALYKLKLSGGIKVADLGKVGIWIGPEVELGDGHGAFFFEPGFLATATLEKLVTSIPLVPVIDVAFDIPLYTGGGVTAAGFALKFGGGAYYFVTPHIGVGAEMHFAFGPEWAQGFSYDGSYWDFIGGARYAF